MAQPSAGRFEAPAPARAMLDWLSEDPRFDTFTSLLPGLLAEHSWFIGGVVRDFLRQSEVSEVRDIDLLYEGDVNALADRLSEWFPVGRTLFGNPSVTLPGPLRLDVFPPATARGDRRSVRDALWHCDLSVNAMAVPLHGGPMVDPTGGGRDLRADVARILPLGWMVDTPTAAYLLERLAGLATRLQLSVVNIDVADRALESVLGELAHGRDPDGLRAKLSTYLAWRQSLP